MKIIKNTSKFDSKKLRSLFCFVHTLIAKDLRIGRLKHWDTLKIEIRHKSHGFSGQAYLGKVYGNGWDMILSLCYYPKDTVTGLRTTNADLKEYYLKETSQLFAHELMHSYGWKHHQFASYPLTKKELDKIQEKFGDVNFLKEKKSKPKVDYVQVRFERVNNNIKQWETKKKRAENALKKLYKKQKYYLKKVS